MRLRLARLAEALQAEPELERIYRRTKALQKFAAALVRVPVDWPSRRPQELAIDLDFVAGDRVVRDWQSDLCSALAAMGPMLERMAKKRIDAQASETVARIGLDIAKDETLAERDSARRTIVSRAAPSLLGLVSQPVLLYLPPATSAREPALRVNWLLKSVFGLRTSRGVTAHYDGDACPVEPGRLIVRPAEADSRYVNKSPKTALLVVTHVWHPALDDDTKRLCALIWNAVMSVNRELAVPPHGRLAPSSETDG